MPLRAGQWEQYGPCLSGLIPPAAADKLDPGMRTVRYVSIRKEADKTKSYNTKQESMDKGKGT